jgi:hypothetical protein
MYVPCVLVCIIRALKSLKHEYILDRMHILYLHKTIYLHTMSHVAITGAILIVNDKRIQAVSSVKELNMAILKINCNLIINHYMDS